MRIDALLDPISAGDPFGPELSFSTEFDAIRELRRQDDATLPQGEWVKELKVADWPRAMVACEAILRTQSKDLRVAGWWTDAACHVNGMAGLADGLALYTQLIVRFWHGIHPAPDGGNFEQRVGAIGWLLGRVEALVSVAPLATHAGQSCSLRDLDQARAQTGAAEAVAGGADAAPSIEALRRIVTAAGKPALDAVLADAERSHAALLQLQLEVDARLGDDGPAFSAARKALDHLVDRAARLKREVGFGVEVPLAEASTAAGADPACTPLPTGLAVAPAQTRAGALRQLREVADFFRRTEPHSPVAYLADKAAKWGEMPLHAWLRSVIKDDGSLAHLEELLGVDAPAREPPV